MKNGKHSVQVANVSAAAHSDECRADGQSDGKKETKEKYHVAKYLIVRMNLLRRQKRSCHRLSELKFKRFSVKAEFMQALCTFFALAASRKRGSEGTIFSRLGPSAVGAQDLKSETPRLKLLSWSLIGQTSPKARPKREKDARPVDPIDKQMTDGAPSRWTKLPALGVTPIASWPTKRLAANSCRTGSTSHPFSCPHFHRSCDCDCKEKRRAQFCL